MQTAWSSIWHVVRIVTVAGTIVISASSAEPLPEWGRTPSMFRWKKTRHLHALLLKGSRIPLSLSSGIPIGDRARRAFHCKCWPRFGPVVLQWLRLEAVRRVLMGLSNLQGALESSSWSSRYWVGWKLKGPSVLLASSCRTFPCSVSDVYPQPWCGRCQGLGGYLTEVFSWLMAYRGFTHLSLASLGPLQHLLFFNSPYPGHVLSDRVYHYSSDIKPYYFYFFCGNE